MSNVAKVTEMYTLIPQGKIMEAMNTYYHDDIEMQENDGEPTKGLKANLAREQDFVDNTEWHGFKQGPIVGDGDVTMVQSWMDFTNSNYGKRMTFTQVAVQHWKDGKIIKEQFIYNPS